MKVGDHVSWETSQGHTQGVIVERHTSDFKFDDKQFRASEEHPMYVVESAKTGARAAHKSAALRKLHEGHQHSAQ